MWASLALERFVCLLALPCNILSCHCYDPCRQTVNHFKKSWEKSSGKVRFFWLSLDLQCLSSDKIKISVHLKSSRLDWSGTAEENAGFVSQVLFKVGLTSALMGCDIIIFKWNQYFFSSTQPLASWFGPNVQMFTCAFGMEWGSEPCSRAAESLGAGSGIKLSIGKGVFLGDSKGAAAAGLERAPATNGAWFQVCFCSWETIANPACTQRSCWECFTGCV